MKKGLLAWNYGDAVPGPAAWTPSPPACPPIITPSPKRNETLGFPGFQPCDDCSPSLQDMSFAHVGAARSCRAPETLLLEPEVSKTEIHNIWGVTSRQERKVRFPAYAKACRKVGGLQFFVGLQRLGVTSGMLSFDGPAPFLLLTSHRHHQFTEYYQV